MLRIPSSKLVLQFTITLIAATISAPNSYGQGHGGSPPIAGARIVDSRGRDVSPYLGDWTILKIDGLDVQVRVNVTGLAYHKPYETIQFFFTTSNCSDQPYLYAHELDFVRFSVNSKTAIWYPAGTPQAVAIQSTRRLTAPDDPADMTKGICYATSPSPGDKWAPAAIKNWSDLGIVPPLKVKY